MKKVDAASKGANCASGRISLRRTSTWMLRLPSSRGRNTRTSGCDPDSIRSTMCGSPPATTSVANATAGALLPDTTGAVEEIGRRDTAMLARPQERSNGGILSMHRLERAHRPEPPAKIEIAIVCTASTTSSGENASGSTNACITRPSSNPMTTRGKTLSEIRGSRPSDTRFSSR